MDDIKFTSLQELYNRLEPALGAKVSEIKRQKIAYIKKADIWNYLKTYKWNKETNLTLIDMVNDILNIEPMVIDEYVKNNMIKVKRDLIIDENDLL